MARRGEPGRARASLAGDRPVRPALGEPGGIRGHRLHRARAARGWNLRRGLRALGLRERSGARFVPHRVGGSRRFSRAHPGVLRIDVSVGRGRRDRRPEEGHRGRLLPGRGPRQAGAGRRPRRPRGSAGRAERRCRRGGLCRNGGSGQRDDGRPHLGDAVSRRPPAPSADSERRLEPRCGGGDTKAARIGTGSREGRDGGVFRVQDPAPPGRDRHRTAGSRGVRSPRRTHRRLAPRRQRRRSVERRDGRDRANRPTAPRRARARPEGRLVAGAFQRTLRRVDLVHGSVLDPASRPRLRLSQHRRRRSERSEPLLRRRHRRARAPGSRDREGAFGHRSRSGSTGPELRPGVLSESGSRSCSSTTSVRRTSGATGGGTPPRTRSTRSISKSSRWTPGSTSERSTV